MKAVILDGYTLNPGDLSWRDLEEICELKVYDRTPKDKILERIGNCEIIITNKTVITKEILEKAPNIKYIGILATGYNVVDIDAAKKLNIPVTNVPAYSTNSVAQHVFALILEICSQVGIHAEAVMNGQWTNNKDFCFWNKPLIELNGKTIGIIGFGSIGQKVAKIALSFGMNVLTYSRTVKKEFESESLKFVNLDDLYRNSDIISLHVPLTSETKGMINKEAINKMKKGVIVINTSRGPVIVEEDLYQGLEDGLVYYAGVDVVSNEPINENSPLLKTNNIFITPHIAWAPKETRERLMKITVDNVKAFIANKYINVVNK